MGTQINSFYKEHAMEFAAISEGVVAVPSEREQGVYYEVQHNGFEAVSCECRGFEYRSRCKHLVIVNAWLASAAPVKVTEIEKGRWWIVNSDTQVWIDEESGQWLVAGPTENALEIVKDHLEKQSAVKEAEEIVAEAAAEETAPETVTEAEESPETALSSRIASKVAEAKKLATTGEVVNKTAAKFASEPVEQKMQAVAAPASFHKVTLVADKDLGTKGTLNGQPQTSEMPAWLAILPSRREMALA